MARADRITEARAVVRALRAGANGAAAPKQLARELENHIKLVEACGLPAHVLSSPLKRGRTLLQERESDAQDRDTGRHKPAP